MARGAGFDAEFGLGMAQVQVLEVVHNGVYIGEDPVSLNMQLSAEGRQALYRRECVAPSFQPSLTAYFDTVGKVWTIWCGITGPDVYEGLTITPAQGAAMEAKRATPITDAINNNVKVSLTQNQWDVIFSFTWNEGVEAFLNSTLLKKLNKGQYDQVPVELKRWNQAGGKVSNGLVNRRGSEIAQWTGTPFVAGGAHAADVPLNFWQRAHNRIVAGGVVGIVKATYDNWTPDTFNNAGATLQSLSAQSKIFATLGISLIVLGVVWRFVKARQ